MDSQTARLVLNIVAAVALVAWLAGLAFLIRAARPRRPRFETGRWNAEPDAAVNVQFDLAGVVVVDGDPRDLIARATAAIAAGRTGGLGVVRIVRSASEELILTGAPGSASPVGAACRLGPTALQFTRQNQQTAVAYWADVSGGKWLLALGGVFLVLGLAALVGGYAAILHWVVEHPFPAVRTQAVQMIQVVHFLWPPFLFGGLYRLGRTRLRAAMESFLQNLPYAPSA